MKKIVMSCLAIFLVACGSAEESKNAKEEVKQEVVQVSNQNNNDTKEVVKTTTDTAKDIKADIVTSIDGKSLQDYFDIQCASCHGNYGEKSALSTSKIIAELSEEEILKALRGFKDGSYGGEFAATMKGNIKALNDDELQALAKFIDSDL